MPTYALRCPSCGVKWETFHKMSEPHPPCAACGTVGEWDPTEQKTTGERRFAGMERMSLQFGFDASEAAEARRMFDGTGATIDDEGDVYFDTRGQERRFRERYKKHMDAAARAHMAPKT